MSKDLLKNLKRSHSPPLYPANTPEHHLERYCDGCWQNSYGHRECATHVLLRQPEPGYIFQAAGWFGCKIHTYKWVARGGTTKPMQEFREDLLVAEAEAALVNEPDDQAAAWLRTPHWKLRDWTRLLRATYALGGNLRGKDLEGYAAFLLRRDFNRGVQHYAPSFFSDSRATDRGFVAAGETRWESDNQYLARLGVAFRELFNLLP